MSTQDFRSAQKINRSFGTMENNHFFCSGLRVHTYLNAGNQ
jgi:hypothetical protein